LAPAITVGWEWKYGRKADANEIAVTPVGEVDLAAVADLEAAVLAVAVVHPAAADRQEVGNGERNTHDLA